MKPLHNSLHLFFLNHAGARQESCPSSHAWWSQDENPKPCARLQRQHADRQKLCTEVENHLVCWVCMRGRQRRRVGEYILPRSMFSFTHTHHFQLLTTLASRRLWPFEVWLGRCKGQTSAPVHTRMVMCSAIPTSAWFLVWVILQRKKHMWVVRDVYACLHIPCCMTAVRCSNAFLFVFHMVTWKKIYAGESVVTQPSNEEWPIS